MGEDFAISHGGAETGKVLDIIKNQRVHKGKLIFHAIGYEPVRATAFLWVGMHQIDDISNVCFVTTEMLQRIGLG